ncbi:MAG TPA: hypothetical protein VGG44_03330 [Tepidisphaeraceae bacterium]
MALTKISGHAIDLSLVAMAYSHSVGDQPALLWLYLDTAGSEADAERPTFFLPHEMIAPFFEAVRSNGEFMVIENFVINPKKIALIKDTGLIEFSLSNSKPLKVSIPPELVEPLLKALPK